MALPEDIKPTKENENSTVFSSPAQHKDKKVITKKKTVIRITASVLAVLLLVTATVAIIKFIPKKEENQGTVYSAETIFLVDPSEFKKITVVNPKTTLEIYPVIAEKQTESGSEADLDWRLEGYDFDLVDQTSLSQIAGYASTMSAIRKFGADDGSYGFDSPFITVEVECETVPSYKITVGNASADKNSYYIKLSDVDTVYLVSASDVVGFNVSPLEIAINTAVSPLSEEDIGSEFFEDGTLTSFSSLTVKSKAFNSDLVIIPNDASHFDKSVKYTVTKPEYRIADNVDKLLSVFASGQSVSGCASYSTGKEYLSAFGLNDPDFILIGKFGNKEYTYKFKEIEGMKGNYYCFASHDRLIRIVSDENAPYLSLSQTDYYQSFMLLESIKDINSMTVSGNDANVNFNINYDADNESYIITANSNEISTDAFKTFYSNLISTTAIDYETNTPSGNYSLVFTLKHTKGGNDTVLAFKKTSDQRYAYFVNGVPLGHITSTAYKNIVSGVNGLS